MALLGFMKVNGDENGTILRLCIAIEMTFKMSYKFLSDAYVFRKSIKRD